MPKTVLDKVVAAIGALAEPGGASRPAIAKAVKEGRVNSRGEDKIRRDLGIAIGVTWLAAVALVPSLRTAYGPLTSAAMTSMAVYGTGAMSC